MKTQVMMGVIVLSLLIGTPIAMACKIPQPFKVWPASPIHRFMLGYHTYFDRDRLYNQTIADDKPFNDGWDTAEKFANIMPTLKETPTSYADGWLVGYHYHHMQLKSGLIPVPPGHSPAWSHGFSDGYRIALDKDFSMGWLAGRHAFLNGLPNIVIGHKQQYQYGFDSGYHANKDPSAELPAYPLHLLSYTDCDYD